MSVRQEDSPELQGCPARRFAQQLDRLQKAIDAAVEGHGKTPRMRPGHLFYVADARTPLFYLEGLARLGRDLGPRRKLQERWLAQFKSAEDRLGAYDYWYDLERRARGWQLPEPLVAYFHERAQHALGALEYALAAEGFWTEHEGAVSAESPVLSAVRRELAELDWPSPKKERKALARLLRDDLIGIEERLADGRIDLEQTEAGIHELRRRLRWLPIYGLASAGKITLDEPDEKGPLGKFITPEMVANKFNQLPESPEERDPVRYHAGAFYACSLLIAEIGLAKDRALFTEEVKRSSAVVGLEPRAVLPKLGADHVEHDKTVATVRELVERVISGESVLARMAEHLDEQT